MTAPGDDVFQRKLREALGSGPARDVLAVLDGRQDAAIVGGWVRDVVAGRDSGDVDLVAADPDALVGALRLAGRLRKAVLLDPVRRTWRAVFFGGRFVDVAALKGEGLAEDLGLRDLRVNAMAWSPGRGLVDPLGGCVDLGRRRLRFASDRALADDPLRALRLWRIALELGAEPADPLPHVDMAGVAPERVQIELARILGHAAPLPAVADLDRAGLLAALLPGTIRLDPLRREADLDPGPAVRRCLLHAGQEPDGMVAVRLGWTCAATELAEALLARRWPRRIARAAEATSRQVGTRGGDPADDLCSWRKLAAWALLGRAILAQDPEEAVRPCLDALDRWAGPAGSRLPVPGLPPPLVASAQVAATLLVAPGPGLRREIGAMVRAQLRGELLDVEAALRWLELRAAGGWERGRLDGIDS